MYYKGNLIEENLEEIKKKILEQIPLAEIARNLGVKYDTLIRHLKRLGVEYATNPNRKGKPHYESRISAMYYIENGIPIGAPILRKKLIEEGIKENKCERCGITEWMGSDVPLELHHLDENHYNNNLDNLVILCSNCHAQLHGYNKSTKAERKIHKDKLKKKPNKPANPKKEKRFCDFCGKELTSSQKRFCSQDCVKKYNSRNKPDKETLLQFKDDGLSNIEIASKYSVTETAVRKWLRFYEK